MEDNSTQRSAPPAPQLIAMPSIPRNLCLAALLRTWDMVRSYFERPQRRSASVLSFRRHAMRIGAVDPAMAQDNYTGKKTSGSVGWSSEGCKIVSQEGGRG